MKSFKQLVSNPGIVRSVGVHDAFSALIMENAGFEMIFVGGFGISASRLGLPDLNLITQTEMVQAVRAIAARVTVPVIADADTGHGGLANVRRTVQEFEAAGAQGILLEDQVFPKRCGHFEGKQVVSAEEFLSKLEVALKSRSSDQFSIIARTDARAVLGFDEAVSRMRSAIELGVDVVFVEAPQSIDELRQLPDLLPAPNLANMLSGGKTPVLPVSQLEQFGFKFVVYPVETLMVCQKALEQLACVALNEETLSDLSTSMSTFSEVRNLLLLDEWQSL